MKELRFKITGTRALMLNNPQTVDPRNHYAMEIKKLTSKRSKTEKDEDEIDRLKFFASLYVKHDNTYIIPAAHFLRSIIGAAKERKLGTLFERVVDIPQDAILEFEDKDKTPDQLYDMGVYVDRRPAGIPGKKVKIPQTRAIFREWSTEIRCLIDESQVNEDVVCEMVKNAGLRYGVGTYRFLYGRFTAEKI